MTMMIVHGGLDALSPSTVEDAKELAALLHAELHLLDGVGHLPLLLTPNEVAALLDRFLGQHCRA